MFKLIDYDTKEDYLDSSDNLFLFDTGAEASKKAKEVEFWFGIKVVVKPYIVPTDEWKDREQGRLDSGEYTKVIPELQKHCLPEHFVHVSKKNPSLIAYTANPDKGVADKQTQSSVMGYLERFAPTLSYKEREEIHHTHMDMYCAVELKWARTPDEIEYVYTHYSEDACSVSESCMRYAADEFTSQFHPVRVYGDSDLSVAYLTDEFGYTVARALVWEEKLIYSRVYGGNDDGNKLHHLLRKKGFKKSCGYYDDGEEDEYTSDKSFDGALLPAFLYEGELDNQVDAHVMPYIDEGSFVDLIKVDGKKKFKLNANSSSEKYYCQHTNGLTHDCEELGERYQCYHCTDRYTTTDSMHYVKVDHWSTELFCTYCYNNRTFFCEGTQRDYYSDSFDCVIVDGNMYEESYAEKHFRKCEDCDEYSKEPLITVENKDDKVEICHDCFCNISSTLFYDRKDHRLYSNDLREEFSATGEVIPVRGIDITVATCFHAHT